ncbi:MAG TPA: shikimate kinase [Candidatus Didemnitutus sp.]|nr:shikimate kinase [Candidatus Didemnitutus sp.]
MKIVFLHGPPACGKYTVGTELARITGFKFFHNHLVVDTLLAVFDFGSPAFIELREHIWRQIFLRALADKVPGLIFTFTPESTVRPEFVDWLLNHFPKKGVNVRSVALQASEGEILRRLDSASRMNFGKLTDRQLYQRLRAAGAFDQPRIPRVDLEVDTVKHAPYEAASIIRAACSL